ncbi:MAG TPA: hypothetical protein VFQ48_07930 [Pseudonocardiaceae bacterium]|nr:hypothetical protein [Pseudonocardiaceae bacterium]
MQLSDLATPGAQFVLLAVAAWLSVFKPGGRVRKRRGRDRGGAER